MKDASNATTTTLYLALSLSLLTVGLAPVGAAADDPVPPRVDDPEIGVNPEIDEPRTDVDPPNCFEDGEHVEDSQTSVLCPDTSYSTACVSHGIVIVERDTTGAIGDVTVAQSTSRAHTHFSEGPPIDLNPFDGEPVGQPDAHADAQQVGFTYTHGLTGLSIEAEVVDSQCDVAAREDSQLSNAAFGDAGIVDLEVSVPSGSVLSAGVLRQTIDGAGNQNSAVASHECELVRLEITGSGPSICPTKNTGLNLGNAQLVLNEVWGPSSSGFQHIYGGAAAHLSFTTGPQTVDVYIGYTAVQVHGDTALPPFPI